MIEDYNGHHPFNESTIMQNAPAKHGVYYCGYIADTGNLATHYVGRAMGEGVTIRTRLLDHLRRAGWTDVTNFGFRVCTLDSEVEQLEKTEIKRLNPKYNLVGK